jgi:hypothetical protein
MVIWLDGANEHKGTKTKHANGPFRRCPPGTIDLRDSELRDESERHRSAEMKEL